MNLPIDIEETHPVFTSWFKEIDTQKDGRISQKEMMTYMNKFMNPTHIKSAPVKEKKGDIMPTATGVEELAIKKPKASLIAPPKEEKKEEEPAKTEEAEEGFGDQIQDLADDFTGDEPSVEEKAAEEKET